MLFFSTLIFGIFLTVSSYSWFSVWMGLEINLLSILPLMVDSNNAFPSESALKYFISQVVASIFLMFSLILIMKMQELIFLNSPFYLNILLESALLTKMGAAPFHFWFPEVMDGLNWMMNLILMTIQKIAPMIILMYIKNNMFYFSIIIVLSAMISGLMGLNQLSLRKIMAYSSINHLAWMLSALLYSNMLWLIYFSIYMIMTISIVLIFNNFNTYYTKQLYNICEINKSMTILITFLFFSLGGIPPFLGFLPKWFVIMSLTENLQFFLSFMLICFTLIVFSFYLRLILLPLMYTKNEMNTYKLLMYPNMYMFQLIMIFSLPISLLIFLI
uniref:NADH dehydrogenase subunit 2 n=1 Tax=Oulema tristis TaxID=2824129 RepID=UPI00226D3723|nr:NADH dehydrogenase subunit 2 [Oulema tristis]UZN44088.1 NADH dehydrogenase subunit 2 [Oulema tristis]